MTPLHAAVLAALLPLAAGPPRLVRLDVRAALGPGGLTGTAALTAAGVGSLPLEPLGVAVIGAKQADGSPLPLAPTAAGVTAPVVGDTRLSLGWSARGDDRFALALPAAAVRTLDLDLPADRTPVAAAAVSGPFPGSAPDRRRWTLAFGGREPLALEVRRPPDPAAGPLVRADRAVRWELAPGVARWSAEFTLDVVRGPAEAVTVALPPELTLTDTSPSGGTARDGRATVPAAGGRVMLAGFAPPASGEWTPPAVELVGGLPGATSVTVSLAPELALAGCDPGGTRLTAADGGRTLTFAGPGTPTLTVAAAGPEVRTTEVQTWTVGRDRSALTLKLTAAVGRGPLDRLALVVPPGFRLAAVRAVPDDPGLTTAPSGDRLTVTLSQPVASGGRLTLEATFAAAPPLPAGDPAGPVPPPAWVHFPAVGVDGATDRQGAVLVATGPGLTAWPAPAPLPFRGRPPGTGVTLAADRPRVAVVSDIAVSAVPGGLAVRATGQAEPEGGPVGSVTLFVPAGWRVSADGAAVQPLAGGELAGWGGVLAAGGGWGVLAAAGPADALAGGLVRVTPPAPTDQPIRLRAVGFVPARPQAVPLPVVLGADGRPPEVRVGGSAAALEFDPPAGDLPPTLVLRPRGAAPPPDPGSWALADPELTAAVTSAGRELSFAVTVTRAAGPVLPVALPAGAVLVAAAVDGKRVERAVGGLPLPDGDGGRRVEVRYRLPPAGWHITAPAPELPADPDPVPVRWRFAPDVRRWPALDSPTEPTPGPPAVWVVPAEAVRLAGYLLAAGLLGSAVAGRLRAVAVAAGLLAAAGFVVPVGWREVTRPPAVVGLLAVAAGTARPRPVNTAPAKLPSTAAYTAAAVCLAVMAAGPAPVRIDTAEYELTAGDGGTAAGVGRFTLAAPVAGPFTLPLTGVRLEAVELDGRPLAVAAGVAGYAFDLQAGPHALTVRFAVPVTAAGGRAVRLGVPDVSRCRVTVSGLAGAEVVSRRGVQHTDGGRVVADHGGGSAVEVRWPAPPAAPAAVRELCLWDAAPGTSRGVLAARFAPAGGPFAELVVNLPDGVEVGSPAVRTDDRPLAATTVREPGRVRVALDPPADRPVWLVLPLAAGRPLRCPTAGAADALVAVRGGPFAEVGRSGVIDFPADGLRPFAEVPELRLGSPPSRVFQRRPGQPAELNPVPAPPAADPVSAETVWTVAHTSTAAGTVRAERAAAGLVAFDLPPAVDVLDARADGMVSRWTRAGDGRVTVWLPGPADRPVTVNWAGELSGAGGDRTHDLPGAVPAGGGPTSVRTEPADGWAVTTTPGGPAAVRAVVFAPRPPAAVLLETVERAGDGLAYRGLVGLPLDPGRPHRLRVTVDDLPAGAVPDLRGPAGVRVGPAERAGESATWPVECDGPATLTVTARLPVGGRLPEAEVRLDGPPVGWAARGLVLGAGLTTDGRPATPIERAELRAIWPNEVDRLPGGTVWSTGRRTVSAEPPKPAPPADPPPAPPAVTPASGRRWLAAAGWLAAFGLLAVLRPAAPERLLVLGLLGTAAVGGTAGGLFLAAAAAGGLLRAARLGAVLLR